MNRNTHFLIVGLGLIGGCYARRLTALGYTVDALDIDPGALDYAKEEGIIARGAEYSDELVGDADFVIFGLYPTALLEWLRAHKGALRPGALITDVSGVKCAVADDAQAILAGQDNEFIASHPMAGRETIGVRNSDEKIFRGANFIITPTEKNTQPAIDAVHELAEILGFGRISILTPREHDEMIGFLSQLTHVIAISLMNCQDNTHLAAYTGDSFRDLTRIARINDKLWSELFLLNRDILEQEIDSIVSELNAVKGLLQADDREGLREKMRQSTLRRAAFDRDKQGGAAK